MKSIIGRRHKIVDHYIEDGTQNLHYVSLEPFNDDPVEDQESLRDLLNVIDIKSFISSFNISCCYFCSYMKNLSIITLQKIRKELDYFYIEASRAKVNKLKKID